MGIPLLLKGMNQQGSELGQGHKGLLLTKHVHDTPEQLRQSMVEQLGLPRRCKVQDANARDGKGGEESVDLRRVQSFNGLDDRADAVDDEVAGVGGCEEVCEVDAEGVEVVQEVLAFGRLGEDGDEVVDGGGEDLDPLLDACGSELLVVVSECRSRGLEELEEGGSEHLRRHAGRQFQQVCDLV